MDAKMAKKAWIVGSVSLIAMSLVLIGCGDEEQEAQNSPPAISSLTASRDTVDPTARVSISCNATDSDHDSLSFNWCASGGEILGSGSQVEWEAPIWAGLYWIKAEVTDGQAIVSDSLSIWVNEGFLLVKTRSEVLKVTLLMGPQAFSTKAVARLKFWGSEFSSDRAATLWNLILGVMRFEESQDHHRFLGQQLSLSSPMPALHLSTTRMIASTLCLPMVRSWLQGR
jgi:hypothetical protein